MCVFIHVIWLIHCTSFKIIFCKIILCFDYSECNGQPPLNNQRTFSPQNSIKSQHTFSPQNSIKSHHSFTSKNSIKRNHSWSRNNSISSTYSIRKSFSLHRENSINSHRTHNSTSSSTFKEEYKLNNLSSELPDVKSSVDKCFEVLEDDPDAMDETVSIQHLKNSFYILCKGLKTKCFFISFCECFFLHLLPETDFIRKNESLFQMTVVVKTNIYHLFSLNRK